MSHSTNSGVALCLKPSNRRLKLSAASLKNPLRETHISTVFEVEYRWPKRAVLNFNLRAARPVLRNSTSMVVKIGASALAKTKSHGELERAVAKLVTTTGPDIRCVKTCLYLFCYTRKTAYHRKLSTRQTGLNCPTDRLGKGKFLFLSWFSNFFQIRL